MKVVVAKVDQVFFDGEADSITLPAAEGEMTVLSEHMPLITTLKAGTIIVRHDAREEQFPVSGGLLEVRRDGATVIL